MKIAYFCFFAAALHGLTGMALGVYMGVAQDFSLAPAHAHVNLVGWVTLALYGLYHRSVQRRANGLAWTQVGCAALGAPAMAGGLAAYLATGAHGLVAVVIGGSLLVVAGMALFLAVLAADLRAGAPRTVGARLAAA